MIDNLQKMLDTGQDDLLLRFGLGQALLKADRPADAIIHLQRALQHAPNHSAAWKLLGKAYAQDDRTDDAIDTYEKGIEVARTRGDLQAVKEMEVFLRRLQKD